MTLRAEPLYPIISPVSHQGRLPIFFKCLQLDDNRELLKLYNIKYDDN